MKRLLLAAAAAAGFSAPACGAEENPFKLVRGNTPKDRGQPASIVYTSDNSAGSSHALAAALVSKNFESSALARHHIALLANMAVGINKSNLTAKPYDLRTIDGNAGMRWSFGADRIHTLFSDLKIGWQDDHRHGARGSNAALNLELVAPSIYLMSAGRAYLKPFPIAGVYQRRVSSTDDAAAAPTGHVGGPYIGVRIEAGLGNVTQESNWFERLRLEGAAMRVRDTWASAAYRRASYRFGELSLSYALYDSDQSAWKPRIAVTRVKGTDRLAGEPHKSVTSVGLQLSYGI